jgi:hypothetical protein
MPNIVLHLVAVVFAANALWSMRHELTERAATHLQWALPPALAIVAAAILLIVSPGKRVELWIVGIVAGLVAGPVMGTTLTVIKDFARQMVRANRTWNGVPVAAAVAGTDRDV